MSQTTALHATQHYRQNKDSYDEIRDMLRDVRNTFYDSGRSKQVIMLQKSYTFAVISVQTPTYITEKAYKQLWNGDTITDDIASALSEVNYRNNKAEYIKHALAQPDEWDFVATMLEIGEIDLAHRHILDTFKGVGTVKAPFVLAMLGFTQKCCLDTNLCKTLGIEQPTTVVVDRYETEVSEQRDRFPTLKEETSPFVWQWIIFSYSRHGVSGEPDFHTDFFEDIC